MFKKTPVVRYVFSVMIFIIIKLFSSVYKVCPVVLNADRRLFYDLKLSDSEEPVCGICT